MTYTINAKKGTPSFSVVDGSVNTDLDISLIGKGYVGYGSALNTNFLRLLENFADTTGNEPTKAITGQLFYNTSTEQLLVYNGSTFARVTPRDTSYNTLSIGTINYDTTSISGTVFNGNISVNANGLGVVNINRLAIQAVGPNKILSTAANGMITSSSLQYNSTNDTLQVSNFNTTGNVGFGTTTPSDAGGTMNVVASSSGYTIIKSIAGTGAASAARFDMATGTPLSYAIQELNDNQGNPYHKVSAGSAVTSSYHDFPTHIWRSGGGATEYMRINSSGNVGIGTNNPAQRLEVTGAGLFKTDTNNFVLIGSDGGNMELCRQGGNAYIDFKNLSTEDYDARIIADTNGTLQFFVNNSERMRINTDGIKVTGNVVTTGGVYWANGTSFSSGAGTGLPGGSNTNIQYNNNGTLAGSSNFVFNATNNKVGIGTTNPGTNLHVSSGSATSIPVGQFRISADVAGLDILAYPSAQAAYGMWTANDVGMYTWNPLIISAGNSAPIRFGTTTTLENPVERMRIDSIGNVGIGTVNPLTKLHVEGGGIRINTTSSTSWMQFGGSSSNGFAIGVDDDKFVINRDAPLGTGDRVVTILSGGNFGIGTVTPAQRLEVFGAGLFKTGTHNFVQIGGDGGNMELCRQGGNAYIDFKSLSSQDYQARIIADSIGTLQFFAGYLGQERMRINYNGNVGIGTIGTTSVDYKLHVVGDIAATNNIIGYYSDDRLKTRLGVIENAVDKVSQLTGFYYEANQTAQDLGYTVKREVGISAQDVQKVLPEVVMPAPIDSRYLTVDYDRIVPLLIEAIKELKAEINQLKGQ
jgi:hypothetical protein